MVEACVLQFKKKITNIQQFIQSYSRAQGVIKESVKIIIEISISSSHTTTQQDKSAKTETGKQYIRKEKEYSLNDSEKYSLINSLSNQIIINEIMGVEIYKLSYLKQSEYFSSENNELTTLSNIKSFIRLEIRWTHQGGIDHIIQLQFSVDVAKDYIDEQQTQVLLQQKKYYIDLFIQKNWEQLIENTDQIYHIIILNIQQTDIVPVKYIIQGLSEMLLIAPEGIKAMLYLQKYITPVINNQLLYKIHKQSTSILQKSNSLKHLKESIIQPIIMGQQAVCVIYDDILVIYSDHIYVEKLAIVQSGVYIFLATVQGNYVICQRVLIYDNEIIDNYLIQMILIDQILQNVNQQKLNIVKLGQFELIPNRTYQLNYDFDIIQHLLKNNQMYSSETNERKQLILQQDGFTIYDNIKRSIKHVYVNNYLTLQLCSIERDFVENGHDQKYVNHTPYQLRIINKYNQLSQENYELVKTDDMQNVLITPLTCIISNISNIYWRPIKNNQVSIDKQVGVFVYNHDSDPINAWIPYQILDLSYIYMVNDQQTANQLLINSIVPFTFEYFSNYNTTEDIEPDNYNINSLTDLLNTIKINKHLQIAYFGNVQHNLNQVIEQQKSISVSNIQVICQNYDEIIYCAEYYNNQDQMNVQDIQIEHISQLKYRKQDLLIVLYKDREVLQSDINVIVKFKQPKYIAMLYLSKKEVVELQIPQYKKIINKDFIYIYEYTFQR